MSEDEISDQRIGLSIKVKGNSDRGDEILRCMEEHYDTWVLDVTSPPPMKREKRGLFDRIQDAWMVLTGRATIEDLK